MSDAVHRSILIALAVIVAALAVASVRLDSATADEGAHIAAGMVKLRHGWLSFFPEQPPLMNVLSALPLQGFRLPHDWKNDLGRGSHWRLGHTLLYGVGNDAHRLLFLARLPTIALFLALCFAVYWVVTHETNRTWGLVAFALTGFCPNLLAHGRLATVDMAATAFMFIAFAFLVVKRSGALAALFAICAILSKTSAVLILPFFLLLWRRPKQIAYALLVAIVVLYAVTFLLASPEYLDAQFPNTPRILVPWLQYKLHVDAIRFWYAQGHEHPQFLLGQFSRTGWPHYYFVAFLLKTPLAAVILFVMALVVAIRKRSTVLMACLAFIALFFAVSMTSKIALGIRYVLPVYPFLYTFIVIALAEKRRAIIVGVFVAWHILSSLIAYPSYISYFNELIGSRRNADKFLIDSNLDWGQDLRRLKLWCDAHGVDFIRVDYFGGGDIGYEFGPRAARWSAPNPELLPKGWFAVSRHFYRVSFDPDEAPVDDDEYLAVSKARYVTTVGGSIDVYRVD